MYSLGEYICLLLIIYLKISLYIYTFNILFIHLNQHYKPNLHAKNIIWLKFTINYLLFKLNYNWWHCSTISLTVVMLCDCTKRVCVRIPNLSAKQCSWQTSAISFPFIPIPRVYCAELLCFVFIRLFINPNLCLVFQFDTWPGCLKDFHGSRRKQMA